MGNQNSWSTPPPQTEDSASDTLAKAIDAFKKDVEVFKKKDFDLLTRADLYRAGKARYDDVANPNLENAAKITAFLGFKKALEAFLTKDLVNRADLCSSVDTLKQSARGVVSAFLRLMEENGEDAVISEVDSLAIITKKKSVTLAVVEALKKFRKAEKSVLQNNRVDLRAVLDLWGAALYLSKFFMHEFGLMGDAEDGGSGDEDPFPMTQHIDYASFFHRRELAMKSLGYYSALSKSASEELQTPTVIFRRVLEAFKKVAKEEQAKELQTDADFHAVLDTLNNWGRVMQGLLLEMFTRGEEDALREVDLITKDRSLSEKVRDATTFYLYADATVLRGEGVNLLMFLGMEEQAFELYNILYKCVLSDKKNPATQFAPDEGTDAEGQKEEGLAADLSVVKLSE